MRSLGGSPQLLHKGNMGASKRLQHIGRNNTLGWPKDKKKVLVLMYRL